MPDEFATREVIVLPDAPTAVERSAAKELAERTPCSACGAANPEGTNFCQQCGAKLGPPAASFCTSCGAKLAAGAPFCGACGAKQPAGE